jgi:hypothetical protein
MLAPGNQVVLLAPALEYALEALVGYGSLPYARGAFVLFEQPPDAPFTSCETALRMRVLISERSIQALRVDGFARLNQRGPDRPVWAEPTAKGRMHAIRRAAHG